MKVREVVAKMSHIKDLESKITEMSCKISGQDLILSTACYDVAVKCSRIDSIIIYDNKVVIYLNCRITIVAYDNYIYTKI